PLRKSVVGVLDPDDGDAFLPRLLDEAADVCDDRVALGSPLDDAVLHVDDEECGVRPVLECGHGLPFLAHAFGNSEQASNRHAGAPAVFLLVRTAGPRWLWFLRLRRFRNRSLGSALADQAGA